MPGRMMASAGTSSRSRSISTTVPMSTTRTSLSAAESSPVDAQDLEAKSTMITPEGFGFSSTTKRVLQQAGRGSGYFKALDTDTVTSVMDGITDGQVDAALVFEEGTDKLLGIFTESDYVQVSQSPSAPAVM